MVSKIGKEEIKLCILRWSKFSLYKIPQNTQKRYQQKKFTRYRPKDKNQLCSNTAATKNPKRKLRNNFTYNTIQKNKTLSNKLDQKDKRKKKKSQKQKTNSELQRTD